MTKTVFPSLSEVAGFTSSRRHGRNPDLKDLIRENCKLIIFNLSIGLVATFVISQNVTSLLTRVVSVINLLSTHA